MSKETAITPLMEQYLAIKAQHKDGRIVLAFEIDGLDEIVWWVLGWSGRAKVLAPTELREHDELRWLGADELTALDLAESDRALLPFVLPLLNRAPS